MGLGVVVFPVQPPPQALSMRRLAGVHGYGELRYGKPLRARLDLQTDLPFSPLKAPADEAELNYEFSNKCCHFTGVFMRKE